jgi:hypothetical protein
MMRPLDLFHRHVNGLAARDVRADLASRADMLVQNTIDRRAANLEGLCNL